MLIEGSAQAEPFFFVRGVSRESIREDQVLKKALIGPKYRPVCGSKHSAYF
jgi:hypothetical protein